MAKKKHKHFEHGGRRYRAKMGPFGRVLSVQLWDSQWIRISYEETIAVLDPSIGKYGRQPPKRRPIPFTVR